MQTILKKQFVQVDALAPGVVARPGAAAPRSCEKSVALLRVEGVVRALELSCSCGEKTVVELDYPDTKE